MRDQIHTARLTLRPITAKDVPALVCQINDLRVSSMTSSIPYPYTEADAQGWVTRQAVLRAGGQNFVYNVFIAGGAELIGAVGLHWTDRQSDDGRTAWELGYWYGVAHWGQGYATEAGAAILREAEATLAPERFTSGHFTENPKSGHVLVKLGFEYTGVIRESFSIARQAPVPIRSLVRMAGAALPDPGGPT